MDPRSWLRSLLVLILVVVANLFPLNLVRSASAQTIGTFIWQIAPYCNVVTFSVAVDGPAFRLSGFDNQCGGAQLPAAGTATPRSDGQYGLSFYVVTPTGLVSHLTAVLSPVSFSGTWSDSSAATGTLIFSPPPVVNGAPRPAPLLPGSALAPSSIFSYHIDDGTIGTEELASQSVTGAKLRLPLSASVNSAGNALQIANTGSGGAIRGDGNGPGGTGIAGFGSVGVKGQSDEAYAVQGLASDNAIGLYGVSSGVGPALRLFAGAGSAAIIESSGPTNTADVVVINNAGTGDLIQASTDGSVRFRVTATGVVQGDGAYTSPAADVAEFIDAGEALTPGDVVEIDPIRDGFFRRAATASSAVVAGVVTTKPGVLLNTREERQGLEDGPALALAGRVPVKVSAENGAIARGDLLVASATPGHAMKSPQVPTAGTVIGKALGAHASGTGVIEMLVMLR